jgi:hypothetical protein
MMKTDDKGDRFHSPKNSGNSVFRVGISITDAKPEALSNIFSRYRTPSPPPRFPGEAAYLSVETQYYLT